MKINGFTIVELLIVIVVIGILAAITIVAYNGIQNRANDASVQSDLSKVARALQAYKAVKGEYPSEAALTAINTTPDVPEAKIQISKNSYDVTAPSGTSDTTSRNLVICIRNGADPQFGIAALSKSGTVFFQTSTNGLQVNSLAWVAQQSVTCPRLGIATTSEGFARAFGYARSQTNTNIDSGWSAWALGQ